MMNWKEFGRKGSWPNFKALSWHLSEVTEENHKKPHNGPSLGQELNPGPSEYKTGVLNTWP
jgi:hypothetical protein